jgi:type VI secretion system protein VasI
MNMKNLLIISAALALAACGDKGEQIKTPTPTPTQAPAPAPTATPPSPTATLDTKALMRCAAETNTVKRLSCFDDFAKANNLAPSSKDATMSAGSKWSVSTDSDPLTDKSVHYAMLEADEGRGRFEDRISLIIRCKSGKTEAYINWNAFLGSDGLSVTSRIDKESAVTSYWSISTDHKASFMPKPVATLQKFEGASSFVVNLTPYSESPITAIFDITGAKDAFKNIRQDCKW